MIRIKKLSKYDLNSLKAAAGEYLQYIASSANVEVARERLYRKLNANQLDTYAGEATLFEGKVVRVRDCNRALKSLIKQRSDELARFSVMQALYDISRDFPRPDLQAGFFAELFHLFMGIQGKGPGLAPGDFYIAKTLKGRKAALARSDELDNLWQGVEKRMAKFKHGLDDSVIKYRNNRREKVLKQLGGSADDWYDWRWHLRHVIKKPHLLAKYISLTKAETAAVQGIEKGKLPFGVTPFYLSLINDKADESDRAVRAQVIPPESYVDFVSSRRFEGYCSLDFMMEQDTSPIDLVTRRYPAIAILKPFNACPQICVYCQRNWEIDEAMAPGAMASKDKIKAAIGWLKAHPAIHDVLVTGGDPLGMSDKKLAWILEEVAAIRHVERIRIGTRTLVTMPMRITLELVQFLATLREPLKREISVVTHVEHPYEVTPEMFQAVELLRSYKINVYNQNVYTFFVSRRFEAAFLRRLLKRIGVEPYYTFNTKGKEETAAYRVPIARLMQEQKEEARLLPGLSRTDEAVYNIPALGKHYLRAFQHRDVISILPDGSRVYEFHPWEKNIRHQNSYVGQDVPILDYLQRLAKIGEKMSDYETIWYYF